MGTPALIDLRDQARTILRKAVSADTLLTKDVGTPCARKKQKGESPEKKMPPEQSTSLGSTPPGQGEGNKNPDPPRGTGTRTHHM